MYQPMVTVLMPAYNGERFLKEVIEGILNQTFTDFEFLIINDGSADNGVKIIKSFNDERIRLINNDKNLKLIASLNKGIYHFQEVNIYQEWIEMIFLCLIDLKRKLIF